MCCVPTTVRVVALRRHQRGKEARRRLHMFVLSVKLLDEVGLVPQWLGAEGGAVDRPPMPTVGCSGGALLVLQKDDSSRPYVRILYDCNIEGC